MEDPPILAQTGGRHWAISNCQLAAAFGSPAGHAETGAESQLPWPIADCSLLLRHLPGHFDIERDGDVVTDYPRPAADSEIHAVDLGRRGGPHAQVAPRIFHGGRRTVHVESNLFGDAVNREIAGNFQFARPGGFNLLRLESDSGIFLHVEEVGAAEVVVSHFDAGIDGSGFDRGCERRLTGCGGVVLHGTSELGEGAAYGGDPQMTDRKLRRAVRRIKLPGVLRGSRE